MSRYLRIRFTRLRSCVRVTLVIALAMSASSGGLLLAGPRAGYRPIDERAPSYRRGADNEIDQPGLEPIRVRNPRYRAIDVDREPLTPRGRIREVISREGAAGDFVDSFDSLSIPRRSRVGPRDLDRLAPPTRPRRSFEALPAPRGDDRPAIQELISRRYQDPAVLRLLSTLSAEGALRLYSEILQLIESRHLEPPPAQSMVERGVANLLAALQNPHFVQVIGVRSSMGRPAQAEQALSAGLRQMPVRTAAEAVQTAQRAMQAASQFTGIPANVVGLEFIYAALESLDPYSAFVPPEEARVSSQQLGDAVVGIGVQIAEGESGLTITRVLQGSPAEEAGLMSHDQILSVDGQPVSGRDLSAAAGLISGNEGSLVTLHISRAGDPAVQVQIVRRRVEIRSVVEVRLVETAARIGYLKLETFSEGSAREIHQALLSLHQQGMQNLILDVRGNPGGLLTAAIEVADLFLPEGTIVSTRGRTEADTMTRSASRAQTWKVPLVVLVDENSASASEILAAAIQDNGRGVIVGRRTYGKGTVQTLFPLSTVSAGLRLTTARFYSPAGRAMAGQGVEPDQVIEGISRFGQSQPAESRDIDAAIDLIRRQMSAPIGYDVSLRRG